MFQNFVGANKFSFLMAEDEEAAGSNSGQESD